MLMQVAARRQVPGWDTKSCSDGEVPVRVRVLVHARHAGTLLGWMARMSSVNSYIDIDPWMPLFKWSLTACTGEYDGSKLILSYR